VTQRLVHLGSTLIDHIYAVAALPPLAGESVAATYRSTPGGGYYSMLAATRSGLPAVHAGPHGTGPNGDALRSKLAEAGIAVLQPSSPLADTGSCVVLLTPDGQRTFVSHAGIEGTLGATLPDPQSFGPGDWIAFTGYLLHYAGTRTILADWLDALSPEVPVVFDPCPIIGEIDPGLIARALRRTTWLSCNAEEAAILAPIGPAALLTRCPNAAGLVIRDGAAGCHLHLRGQSPLRIPAPAVTARDTNGAGDVHIGAFIAALSHGASPADATRYANAAAALAVSRNGGASAPTRAEVEALVNLWNNPSE
jgi:sugar/nucleoside kinase (ribokinase family)